MATNKLLLLACMLVSTAAWSREPATSTCQSAATKPAIAIANAKAALDGNPGDLRTHFSLADALSDAGCFNEAVQVLQNATVTHPGNKELETRLRVARSLVGEEHFFDNLDRADAAAKLKRETFRCSTLYDLEACNDALRMKPDDPALLIAQGDALLRAKRPADAVNRYRLAAVVAPNQRDVAAKIAAAESQLPASPNGAGATAGAAVAAPPRMAAAPAPPPSRTPRSAPKLRVATAAAAPIPVRRYTNAAPETQSH